MSGSAVLDTALGVVFVFLTASVMCAGVVEWISGKLDKRGEYLLRGLREMLDIRPGTDAASLPRTGLLEHKRDMPATLRELEAAGATLVTPAPPDDESADLPTAPPPRD